ncbi:hypothetical protein G7K_4515-t1 [Saitoella complicata NRRL Y-17804]|uniref:Uncharacterized protein n=1 Tax=Saitoella complicata (strain BCRC 22490 / CBS 7301 / JCM 7358 / NBRC 10748 / NRRL Y-17804) TaxID=698492 RepID=A0A0E9NKM9_SAICN|nr:hypothetical protein G7K_4515-t1 [Saitoella complicata NRRL Y-17804]
MAMAIATVILYVRRTRRFHYYKRIRTFNKEPLFPPSSTSNQLTFFDKQPLLFCIAPTFFTQRQYDNSHDCYQHGQ